MLLKTLDCRPSTLDGSFCCVSTNQVKMIQISGTTQQRVMSDYLGVYSYVVPVYRSSSGTIIISNSARMYNICCIKSIIYDTWQKLTGSCTIICIFITTLFSNQLETTRASDFSNEPQLGKIKNKNTSLSKIRLLFPKLPKTLEHLP